MEKTTIPSGLRLVIGHDVLAVLLGDFIINDERVIVVFNLEDSCIETFENSTIAELSIVTAGEILNSPVVRLLKRDIQADLFRYMEMKKRISSTANINQYKEEPRKVVA